MTDETTTVTDRSESSRFEAHVDGALAGSAEYRLTGTTIVFTHTEVDDAHAGQGVGSTLVRQALDDVRERGLTVVPVCPFVKRWIERHPEYADLL